MCMQLLEQDAEIPQHCFISLIMQVLGLICLSWFKYICPIIKGMVTA